uniref:Uncharacterized protein n=1 Tax=Rhizophora mucronata TaxID=61149 RepID=A0A2P2QL49_RHIMU
MLDHVSSCKYHKRWTSYIMDTADLHYLKYQTLLSANNFHGIAHATESQCMC